MAEIGSLSDSDSKRLVELAKEWIDDHKDIAMPERYIDSADSKNRYLARHMNSANCSFCRDSFNRSPLGYHCNKCVLYKWIRKDADDVLSGKIRIIGSFNGVCRRYVCYETGMDYAISDTLWDVINFEYAVCEYLASGGE